MEKKALFKWMIFRFDITASFKDIHKIKKINEEDFFLAAVVIRGWVL